MKKPIAKTLCLVLALAMVLGLAPMALADDEPAPAAEVSAQTLAVDGTAVDCEKYNIDGYNYFKLRDLAALLSGTDFQFDVGYDAASGIATVTTGKAYTAVGGELAQGADNSASCVASDWTLLVDGEAVDCEVYNLGGYNYFKLRDLGEAIGFGVDFDEDDNAAFVGTVKSAIESVTAIGFVDRDGAKLKAIAVEYAQDLAGAALDKDTFALSGYTFTSTAAINNGEGEVGDVTAIYVNDKPEVSAEGGSGSGNYIIIELYTDYLYNSETAFTSAMSAGVTQKKAIAVGGTELPASLIEVKNYTKTESAGGGMMGGGQGGQGGGQGGQGGGQGGQGGGQGGPGGGGMMGGSRVSYTLEKDSFIIPDIASFKYYTSNETAIASGYPVDGPAFVATDCFDEKDGSFYEEFPVAYALSLPADYSEDGHYAMVVLDNPATEETTHPLQSVLETRSPAVYASAWAQDIVKETHGLDGLIVVVPVVTARVDDNACSPAQYDGLVQLWDYLIDTYHVDADHVYGSGQSVGGMVLLETQRNRDNYFAGLMLYEDQWAQNYYKDGLFVRNQAASQATANTAPYHYPRTNAALTWDYYLDTEGNPVTEGHDPSNYLYLVSDDNILIMNRSGNNLSNDTWRELSYLYGDLVGAEVAQHLVSADLTLDECDADIAAYLAEEKAVNINWVTIENGINGYSCRQVLAGYEWLLKQDRQTEIAREKLDLNKPFEIADEQIRDDSRKLHYTAPDGSDLYYWTGKAGAGTQFYNTVLLPVNGTADEAPGWLPEGMSWEAGVGGAGIVSVTAIGTDAVAVEYSADMSGLVANLKGDPIYELYTHELREGETVIYDPYVFYDADGNALDMTIRNIYVNDSAAVRSGAERQSGSGSYVIVEIEGASAPVAGVKQQTTLRTNTVFAEPSATIYK